MKGILDTHTLIWYLQDDARLHGVPLALVKTGENDIMVSVVSCWEIAIKASLGKIKFGKPFHEFIWPHLRSNGFELLQISKDHLNRLGTLPLHHRDPFDRLLVAQALVEDVPLLSIDAALDVYGIQRVW